MEPATDARQMLQEARIRRRKRWALLLLTPSLIAAAALFWVHRLTSEGAMYDDVRIALFEYQSARDASANGAALPAYYLRVDGRDPSRRVLGHFARHAPPVRPGSQAGRAPDRSVIDPASGRTAIIYSVDDVRMNAPTEATAGATHYVGTLGARGGTYALRKIRGKWSVVSVTPGWFS